MKTKRGFLLAFAVLAIVSLLMAACQQQTVEDVLEEAQQAEAVTEEATEEPMAEATEEPTEEATEEPTEAATEEPTEEPTAESEMGAEAAVEANLAAFLSGMEGYNATNPTAVNEMMVEGTDFFLLDVRTPAELEENGYIEGAVNIPLAEIADNVDKLPSYDTPVITYCAKGTRATFGMMALAGLGYTDVKAMMGDSFAGWVAEGYPVAEGMPEAAPALNAIEPDPAAVEAVSTFLTGLPEGYAQLQPDALNGELVDGADLVLIDVRRPEEVAENGQIEGAVNIPLEEFVAMKDQWPAMDADIVVYCKAGYRGNISMSILRTFGYENVRNLVGGFDGWAAAGFPVVEGEGGEMAGLDANVAAFLGSMEGYNATNPTAVNEMIVEGQDFFLLDVRTPAELEENGYIEGAVNIPVLELAQNVDKLPSFDTPIVTYCAAGTRATIGMVALSELGFTNVKAMMGNSFAGWVEAGYPVVEGAIPEAETLNEADPDPAVVAAVDAMLSNMPQGYAQLKPEDLNGELVDGADLVLVDVRRPEEVAENGKIEGAVEIPLEEFIAMKDQWPAMDADIVTYCKAGLRGNIAMTILRTFGYENVRNLAGGFDGWAAAGFPVVTE
jgi:rhodanese-related sulfurtransferase